MTINQWRRAFAKTNILLGDVQAVKRGRITERVANRVIGRWLNKLTKGLWR